MNVGDVQLDGWRLTAWRRLDRLDDNLLLIAAVTLALGSVPLLTLAGHNHRHHPVAFWWLLGAGVAALIGAAVGALSYWWLYDRWHMAILPRTLWRHGENVVSVWRKLPADLRAETRPLLRSALDGNAEAASLLGEIVDEWCAHEQRVEQATRVEPVDVWLEEGRHIRDRLRAEHESGQ